MSDPRRTPPLVLPNFPYKGRFSREQLAEAMDRKDRLVETLMDPVGPDGTLINLPVDMLHILAFHQALAGVDAHTDHRQLIEARTVRDESQMFEMSEWRPRGDFGDQADPEPEQEQDGGEAAGIAAQMRTQLSPEVRKAVAAILAQEFTAATAATTVTDTERAHNVLLEQRTMKEATT
jgi:hypothetical protein